MQNLKLKRWENMHRVNIEQFSFLSVKKLQSTTSREKAEKSWQKEQGVFEVLCGMQFYLRN